MRIVEFGGKVVIHIHISNSVNASQDKVDCLLLQDIPGGIQLSLECPGLTSYPGVCAVIIPAGKLLLAGKSLL